MGQSGWKGLVSACISFSIYITKNMPIQIYWKLKPPKTENFQIKKKKSVMFQISTRNIDCRYSLEPPRQGGSNEYLQSMFLSRNKKNNIYPCKTQLLFVALWFILRGYLFYVLCYFVLVFFSPFSIAITSLGEERANLSAFRTFVRFALVWFCLFPLPLGAWEGQRFVIVALPGLFSYPFFAI